MKRFHIYNIHYLNTLSKFCEVHHLLVWIFDIFTSTQHLKFYENSNELYTIFNIL